MNAGGLLWPTVRERAKALHVTREKEKLAFWVQLGLNLGLIRLCGAPHNRIKPSLSCSRWIAVPFMRRTNAGAPCRLVVCAARSSL